MKALRPLIVFEATDVMEAIRPPIETRLTLTLMRGPRYVWHSISADSRLLGIAVSVPLQSPSGGLARRRISRRPTTSKKAMPSRRH